MVSALRWRRTEPDVRIKTRNRSLDCSCVLTPVDRLQARQLHQDAHWWMPHVVAKRDARYRWLLTSAGR